MKQEYRQERDAAGSKPVHRRHVFYIPGYDPFPPRRYRELYRSESAAQAEISGYRIEMRGKLGRYGWRVGSKQDGVQTETDIEVLVWSDIVRASMASSIPATYGQLLRTAWIYLRSGALLRLMRLRKGPVIAALYPVLVLVLQLVLALVLGWVGGGLVAVAGQSAFGLTGNLTWIIWALTAAVCATLVLRWFRRHDGRIFAYYLMHDYAFTARWRGADPPELQARVTEFATRIRAALASDVDEVLVVGHSSGVHIAISALSQILRAGLPDTGRPALGFLSLGQVVPMVSFLPKAQALRRDLAYLSARDDLFWLDVTAPGDGCAFALCDPVAVSGVAPAGQCGPLVISAAFTKSLSPARWQDLRRRWFRLHFQYLCAFDRPRDYDYFRVTAGPVTLSDRFAGRAPSPGRITRPVNRYRSVP